MIGPPSFGPNIRPYMLWATYNQGGNPTNLKGTASVLSYQFRPNYLGPKGFNCESNQMKQSKQPGSALSKPESGKQPNTTSSSPSLHLSETSDYFLEEFVDELTHITFPLGNDDRPFDAESDLRELEYLLNHDPIKDMDSIFEDSVDENSLNDDLVDTIPKEFADELAPSDSFPPGNNDMTLEDVIKEVKCLLTQSPLANYSLDNDLINTILEMFTNEHALDYSSPPLYDDYDDDLFDHETINDDTYDDPFDFKEEKIKDSKILDFSVAVDALLPYLDTSTRTRKRISDKRTKNQAKIDKIEHGMEKHRKDKSTKQSIFATSSAEAEYIAASDTSKEAVWIRKFIYGLGVVPTSEEPMKMYCDNTGAISIANEPAITKGARHYRAKVYYLREVIVFCDNKLVKVHTDDNVADPFTKALPFNKHSEHIKNIVLLPANCLM
ncbi:hypothetical protein Tco_1344887 [Tanacetum coccineum]